MTNNNQKAFKEAQKELQEDKINEIKNVMLSILQEIQKEKEKKIEAEENLRLLKLDMEDLRMGKIQKIKDRHEKSKKAATISPIKSDFLKSMDSYTTSNGLAYSSGGAITDLNITSGNAINWHDATSGVYNVNRSNGQIKEFNL